MCIVDGAMHSEEGVIKKAEIKGFVRVEEKDFPGVIEVHQQGVHFLHLERIGECPEGKKKTWKEFPGWTNDPEVNDQEENV